MTASQHGPGTSLLLVMLAFSSVARAGEARPKLGPPEIDEQGRRIIIPGQVARQNVYEQLKGAIEYVAVCPGGKQYEALFICPVEPQSLHAALMKIGLKPGQPAHERDGTPVGPKGDCLSITLEWSDGGKRQRADVGSFVLDTALEGPMPQVKWVFSGSRQATDPSTGEPALEAAVTGNLISLHQLDPGVLIQNPTRGASENGRYKANLKRLPEEGTPVRLIIEAVSLQRIHVRISGRVQGVGFRDFARRSALELGVRGWVRNLPDGDVELVAEAEPDVVQQFRQKVARGPRSAQVTGIRPVGPPSPDTLGEFEILPTPEAK